tara:strand:- start:2895 stop:3032 length:138 start_codon:yes stop_codon:yes gene_type:complete
MGAIIFEVEFIKSRLQRVRNPWLPDSGGVTGKRSGYRFFKGKIIN